MARERRAKLRKLARFSLLRQSVIGRILHGWSPQQIAGRMRPERHPISIIMRRSITSPISRTVTPSNCGDTCRSIVQTPARYARRRHVRVFSREVNILNPDVVAARKQFGYRECVLMQFRKKFGKANVTSLVERVIRFR
ncbi:IS30 family transposase [Rhizobium leguminosarum]|jgi:IS30 family transposase